MTIPVFIPHWNRAEMCGAAVGALLEQTVPTSIVVFDNASRPEVRERLRELLDGRAAVRELDKNIGFGPAANIGLREWLTQADVEFAVVAAHDALPEATCLEELAAAMRAHPRAGIVSAETGLAHVARFSAWRGPWLPGHPRGHGFEAQDFPHGTLLMLRRACAAQVGLFDERFFAYGDEIELGLRARRAGWEVGVVWGALVTNPERSVPSDVASYLQVRNALAIVREWEGNGWGAVRSALSLVRTVQLAFVPSLRPAAFSTIARLRAIADVWRNRLGPPPPGLLGGEDQ